MPTRTYWSRAHGIAPWQRHLIRHWRRSPLRVVFETRATIAHGHLCQTSRLAVLAGWPSTLPRKGGAQDSCTDEEDNPRDTDTVPAERMLDLHKKLASATIPAEKKPYQRQIEATDAETDALVYELYRLTEEDMAIVEGQD